MARHSQRRRDERLVIGITGRIGAGKTSAGKYLSSAYGFQYLRFSQVLSEWLAKDPDSQGHLQEIGWEVMVKGMQGELNRRLIAQIMPDADVAVDGLRHPLDYESLKNSFGSSFHLLFIESAREDRWDRKRPEGRHPTLSSFEAADSHPVEGRIELLQAHAALVLRNESSLEDLCEALDEAIRGLRRVGHI